MSNTIVTKAHLFPLTIGELLDHINQYDVNSKLNKNEIVKRIVVSRKEDVTKGCLYVPLSFESDD